ncbi:hypothetical protein [Paraburkholderia sp. XV]|uniref:hypothetical protein n=1 Tax=Paraburkholderia sp. XV TaxID=2831520 RepID=UPI001CD44595|nr:hypothetical protein [Paraburkholderia sp. XV]
MKTLTTLWVLAAALAALGIALDMHRLKVNRIGLSAPGWVLVCMVGTLPAVGLYLLLRARVWRTLLDAAWRFAGDGTQSPDVRRKRLDVLRDTGVIGEPVYRACVKTMNTRQPGSA